MATNQNFTDYFKMFGDFKPAMDFDTLFTTQRRNIEALSEANQVVAESAQAISRRQAEVMRSHVESFLKASREMMSGASPETAATRQAELMRNWFENSLSNLREMSEMLTKSSYEAFDVLNKRAAENFEEMNHVSGNQRATGTTNRKGHK